MAQYTYHELRGMTLAQLREIAVGMGESDAVKGYTQLNKEHLLVMLCKALGVDMHEHHEVRGINKADVKARIKELKKQRDAAIDAHDRAQLKQVRRNIHNLKRRIHKATV
ncbi:MAG TPA: hypothetical protein VJT74_10355 [Pyrinomonadaceae bacterium]|nr:hypothetical protein [Pyrinomonadaceae bacterium]